MDMPNWIEKGIKELPDGWKGYITISTDGIEDWTIKLEQTVRGKASIGNGPAKRFGHFKPQSNSQTNADAR